MDIRVDFAGQDDLPAMVDLLVELFSQEHDFVPEPDKQRAGLRLILDHPDMGRLFVLRIDGRVAGMANAVIAISTAEGARVMRLEDVILGCEWRGRGLGARLVQHVLDWARAEGLTRATLLTDHDNAVGQAFYGRLGFEPSAMKVLRRRL